MNSFLFPVKCVGILLLCLRAELWRLYIVVDKLESVACHWLLPPRVTSLYVHEMDVCLL